MSQEWQQGSAVRKPTYDAPNPFVPVDYTSRLQNAGKRSGGQAQQVWQPGQLYGAPAVSAQQPVTASPPPAASPDFAPPPYLPPSVPAQPAPAFYPESVEVGAPYPAQGFAQQPAARMPSGLGEDFYSARQADEIAAFFAENAQPVYDPMGNPPQSAGEEPVLRDAFEPAAPQEESKPHKQPSAPDRLPNDPARSKIRVGRLVALIAAVAMLLFCVTVLGKIIWALVQTENAFLQAQSAYQAENGVDLRAAGTRVDLLPAGQTFVPTATPTPTLFVPTPSPTPIFAINEAAVHSLAGASAVQAAQPDPEPTPVLRTRLTAYPRNPLCNIMESLEEIRKTNDEIVGHLVISGVLDELVVQRNNTYYLTRDAYGLNDPAGSVFVDESCSLRMPPENLLLRGQSTIPGDTFAPLWQFASGGSAFVTSTATATLTTLYEQERYVLFAVITASSDPSSPSYFNFASHPTFATDESMLAYVNTARRHSLYPLNIDVAASDRLLTLATIGGDSTLVLMYRMVRDGENY